MADLETVGVKAVVEGFEAYVRQVQELDKSTAAAAKGISGAASETDKANAAFGKIQKASAIATAGFAGLGIAAVKMGMDFERQIDQVGAISNATEQDMGSLRQTALKLGADTAFSAGQAADAMEELAAGGRSVAQIVGGDAKAAVDLAAAGNYGLADSARVVATSMTVWQREGVETTDIVNRLAGAANASRFGVDDMAQAIAMGGGVAEAAGVSFGDFTTSIAATASAFSSGSDAGTSFKTFITALTGNSQQAKDALKDLGIVTADGANQFYDATGKLKSMDQIVQILHDSLGGLSEEQQTVAMKTIFGNDAYRTAAMLMRMTGEEFKTMSSQMANTSAADIAAKRMGNLSGDLEQLKGSLETLGIQLGSKTIPVLRDMAQGATEATNAFGELPGSTQALILGVVGVAAALPAMIGAFEKGKAAIRTIGDALDSTRGKFALTAAGIGALAIAGDLLLQKTTGHGLIEWLFGDPRSADVANKAIADLDARLRGIGPNASRVAVSIDMISTAYDTWFDKEARFQQLKTPTTMLESQRAAKDFSAQIEALGKEMVKANATFDDFQRVHDMLPGAFQKDFDSVVNFDQILKGHQDTLDKNVDTTRFMIEGWNKVGDGANTVARETPKATDAISQFTESLGEAANDADKLQKSLDNLDAAFSTLNPQAAAARAEHARLTEELARLESQGDSLTASQKARADQIKNALLPALEAEIDAHDRQQTAIKGEQQAVEQLLGPTGYGALRSKLMDLKVPYDDQVALNGQLSQAYYALTHNDLPGAIGKFEELKGKLNPEVWAIIAQAVGPELARQISAGLNGPEMAAAVSRAGGLGADMVNGIIVGIQSRASDVQEAFVRMLDGTITTAREVLRSRSPSRLTAEMIGIPMAEGVALGISEGWDSVDAMMRDSLRALQTTVEHGFTLEITPATEHVLNAWRDTLVYNLKTGESLSKDQIGSLINTLQGAIANANLPDSANKLANATISALVQGFQSTGSLANQTLIDMINGLVATATAGAAKVGAAVSSAAKPATSTPGAKGYDPVRDGPLTQHVDTDFEPVRYEWDGPTLYGVRPDGTRFMAEGGDTIFAKTPSEARNTAAMQPGYYDPSGRWHPFNVEYVPNGATTLPGFKAGTSYVPYDMLAWLHEGETVTRKGALGTTVASPGAGDPGGVGGRTVTIDMRGATLTGTLAENEAMMTRVARRVLNEDLSRDAFLAGVRVLT